MKYVADKGEKAVFQYVDEGRHCREHLHLKCVQCGRIYHLDCHFMDEVRASLSRYRYTVVGLGLAPSASRCSRMLDALTACWRLLMR